MSCAKLHDSKFHDFSSKLTAN